MVEYFEFIARASSGFMTFKIETGQDETVIDWGDGTTQTYPEEFATAQHTYSSVGDFTIKVYDDNDIAASNNDFISIKILEGVTSIRSQAFNLCETLTNLELPESLTHINRSAFSFCTALEKVIIPENTIEIGPSAFEYCRSLNYLIINGKIELIGANAFSTTNLNYQYYYTGTFEHFITIRINDNVLKACRVNYLSVIVYRSNGGTKIPNFYGFRYPNPLPIPVKDRNEFAGWFENSEFITPVVPGAVIMPNYQEVYAKWISLIKVLEFTDKDFETVTFQEIEQIVLLNADRQERVFALTAPETTVYADIVLKYPNDHERVYEHISQITVPTSDGNTATFYLQP